MSKVLFCYDGPIFTCNNNYYSVGFTNTVLKRYLLLADELIFGVRVQEKETIDTSKFSQIDNPNIDVVGLPSISSPVSFIKNRKKAKEILADLIDSIDYVVIRLPSVLGILCWKIAKKKRKTVIVEIVGNAKETFYYHSFFGKMVCLFYNHSVKKAIRHSDYVSYLTKSYLQTVYPTNGLSAICPNVVINKISKELIDAKIVENELLNRKTKIVIGSIGTVSEYYKGHEFVIKALPRLIKKTGLSFEYRIIGDGDCERLKRVATKNKANNSVVFVGQLKHDNIVQELDKIDIYVQPSLSEAQGRSLIEAMSRGCLCLCSNVGGMKELIRSELRFRKKSPNDIVNKMLFLIRSDATFLKQNTIDNAKKADDFLLEVVNSQRENFYKRIKEKGKKE